MSTEQSSFSEIKMGSERGFGMVFAVVFIIIAFWPWIYGAGPRVWALIIAAAFTFAGLVFPKVLRPLNILWFKFGLLLGKIMTPIVMALLFLTTFIPVSMFLRVFGKDNMKLKLEKQTNSYWISRAESGDKISTMNNQF